MRRILKTTLFALIFAALSFGAVAPAHAYDPIRLLASVSSAQAEQETTPPSVVEQVPPRPIIQIQPQTPQQPQRPPRRTAQGQLVVTCNTCIAQRVNQTR